MAAETRSARLGAANPGDAGPAIRAANQGVPSGVLSKEGEYWAVGYGGKTFRLKDTKGLGYLAHLIRHPVNEFHVLDLVGGIAGHREDDENNSSHGLPRGDEALERSGIHIGSLLCQ